MIESNPLEELITPWGKWEVLVDSSYCKVKRIIVTPNNRLSYQTHKKREELWMIVKGIATIILNDEEKILHPGERIFIPKGAAHRIGNFNKENLVFIEIQLLRNINLIIFSVFYLTY